jgi:hypothetical protein
MAIMHHWHGTGSPELLDVLERAVRFFQVPISSGGVTRTADGGAFYEEYPIRNESAVDAFMVLNGHLTAIDALFQVHRRTRMTEALHYAELGAAALPTLLSRFDLGTWSKYDLGIEKRDILFRIFPLYESGEVTFRSIGFAFDGKSASLDLRDPWVGAVYLSGTDWQVDAGGALGIRNAWQERCTPPQSGTLQNTYVIMSADILEAANESLAPRKLAISMRLKARTSQLILLQLGFQGRETLDEFVTVAALPLPEGFDSTVNVTVPLEMLAAPLAKFYHDYQTELVHSIAEDTGDVRLRAWAETWSRYSTQAPLWSDKFWVGLNSHCRALLKAASP